MRRRLHVELSQNGLGQFIRVEHAGMGKLQNPHCDKFDNGGGPGQPHSGARLPECAVQRCDLVTTKGWRATSLIFVQRGASLAVAPLWVGSAGRPIGS